MTKNFSVNEFCANEGISRSMFYKLLKLNLGPRIHKIGRLTKISFHAAEEWRTEMEQKTFGKCT